MAAADVGDYGIDLLLPERKGETRSSPARAGRWSLILVSASSASKLWP